MIDNKSYLNHLRKEYDFTAKQYWSVWQTYATTFAIAVSGFLIAIILASDKYPASGPLFILFPFGVIAWFIMMHLQGKELDGRCQYMAILEREIKKRSGEPFPCVESRLRTHLYSSWRYKYLKLLVAVPFLLDYVFKFKQSLQYIQIQNGNH
ncbi:MAG: hypothetical protein ABIL62_11795 [Planctomycetota bacterium]